MRRRRETKIAPSDPFAAAMDHAWNWFTLHADQRIRTMNMYFVIFALLTAGYGTFLGLKSHWIAAVLAGIGAIASLAFFLLEERNRTLVKLAEHPLRKLQSTLAETASLPSLLMLDAADTAHGWKRMAKYSWVFRAITISGLILMIAGIATAVSMSLT